MHIAKEPPERKRMPGVLLFDALYQHSTLNEPRHEAEEVEQALIPRLRTGGFKL